MDLSSVRETAVMGLQRLEAVDQDFSPFQVGSPRPFDCVACNVLHLLNGGLLLHDGRGS